MHPVDQQWTNRFEGTPVATATELISVPMRKTQLFRNIVLACRECGIQVLSSPRDANEYFNSVDLTPNYLTWGRHERLATFYRNGKNPLFFENSLLCQKSGVFIDSRGYFSSSTIRVNAEYDNVKYWELYGQSAITHFRQYFPGCDLFDLAGNVGTGRPIVVIGQTPVDSSVQFYAPAWKRAIAYTLEAEDDPLEWLLHIVGVWSSKRNWPIVVRPHPLAKKEFLQKDCYSHMMRKNMTPAIDGDLHKDVLPHCSGVITINSTVAIEAAMRGLPVATFGQHIWTGSGAMIEAELNHNELDSLYDMQTTDSPHKHKLFMLLSAIMAHTLPYDATVEQIGETEAFQDWAGKALESKR